MIFMQRIYPTSLTPAQYVEQEHHKQVKAPENCPNCSRAQTLEALAYYHRYYPVPLVQVKVVVPKLVVALRSRIESRKPSV